MKIKSRMLIMIITIVATACACIILKDDVAYAQEKQIPILAKCYENSMFSPYVIDDKKIVPAFSSGRTSVGTLNIIGTDITNTVYNSMNAYGTTGNVSFSYSFPSTILSESETDWYIINDDEKKVNGRKLDKKILMGALLIQKKHAVDEEYTDAANPVLNFFETTPSGKILYKTSGEDINQGTYYRITLAYKTRKKTGKVLWWNTYDTKRNIEVYEFYVVENSGIISVHNLSTDEEIVNQDEYTQELLKHGETLLDESITRDGFEIDNPASSYTITVKHNEKDAVSVKSGDKFTEDGKYVISVTTRLNKKNTIVIYVFKGGNDKGYKTYFGDNFIQAERVFRYDDYPTYARGGRLHINAVNSSIPGLFGTLVDVKTNKELYKFTGLKSEQTYPLEPGIYQADLYNGNKDVPGSTYHYRFVFRVINENSAPYVNYNNLMHSEELKDLATKHYEVAYQTTRGGYVFVCFSLESYDTALEYAREIEARYVEHTSDGGFYYKSEKNPNRKIKYYDQIELTRVSEIYAKQNVEINYFDATDIFTYKTYNNDLLDNLEQINEAKSIKVFPSQEEKEKLIDRAPFLNRFMFIQATDFDVTDVKAICDTTKETVQIALGKPIDEQLKVSSLYHITETNKYGKNRKYDAYYLNECQTQMNWILISGKETQKIPISYESSKNNAIKTFDADAVYVDRAENLYDPWAIITVKAPEVYSVELKCLVSEFKDLAFTKAGYYELSMKDRIGNHYEIAFNISGKGDTNLFEKSINSYAEFYNTIYENHIDIREDTTDLAVLAEEKEVREAVSQETNQDEHQNEMIGDDISSDVHSSNIISLDKEQERTEYSFINKNVLLLVGLIVTLTIVAIFILIVTIKYKKRHRETGNNGETYTEKLINDPETNDQGMDNNKDDRREERSKQIDSSDDYKVVTEENKKTDVEN